MFWKKKNKSQAGNFTSPKFGPREAFRVRPSFDEPIFLRVGEVAMSVFDVSSGGISFRNNGLDFNKTYTARFYLPDEDQEIETELQVLRIENENICYAQFIDLPEKDEEKVQLLS